MWQNWNTWFPFITYVKTEAGLRGVTPAPHRCMPASFKLLSILSILILSL